MAAPASTRSTSPRPFPSPSLLPGAERLESRLADKKPLLTLAEARSEADRCLYCADAPCIQACPTSIDVPTFIKKIASGNVRGSAQTIFEQNLLGYSCARVCPVEVLCEGSCVYTAWQKKPIAIGRLQRFATELAAAEVEAGAPPILAPPGTSSGKKVAIIGAGPASLACAGTLALAGHKAVIFEGRAVTGGLNTTGIAPYKMHADDALEEADWVRSLGDVELRTGQPIHHAAELLADFDALFVGVGLGADTPLGVPGEAGPGVIGATAWIERMKLSSAEGTAPLGRVVVIGGGNTAIDVARECAQLGAREVTMAYRRGGDAMSAYHHELDAGRKEGVRIVHHAQPTEILRAATGEARADGPVIGVRFARTNVVASAGTFGEAFDIPADLVVLAIGQAQAARAPRRHPRRGARRARSGEHRRGDRSHRQPARVRRRRLRQRRQGSGQRRRRRTRRCPRDERLFSRPPQPLHQPPPPEPPTRKPPEHGRSLHRLRRHQEPETRSGSPPRLPPTRANK